MIALLLISLCSCSAKPTTKIKLLSIPDKYLQCEKLPNAIISDEAQELASTGNYRLFSVEMVEDRVLLVEGWHNKCVTNARLAREYQNRMKK